MIGALGLHVMERSLSASGVAARRAGRLTTSGMSVNVSGRQLEDPSLPGAGLAPRSPAPGCRPARSDSRSPRAR